MNAKVTSVVAHGDEDIRLMIYRDLATTGLAPSVAQMATRSGLETAEVKKILQTLSEHRDVVLGRDGDIMMAHPFATIPLGFSVMGESTLWWGGCAWDSFAIPHLLDLASPVLIATRCPACNAPHAWNVGRHQPASGDQVAHFLTPTSRIWDDVVHSCAHQRIFCSTKCVHDWLRRTGQDEGYIMDLATLWRLASDWYSGRMARGYQRREPTQAIAYFAEVGLGGSFWGLPDHLASQSTPP